MPLPDGSCCAPANVVTDANGVQRCCTYCNSPDQLCATAAIEPASDPSCTWLESQYCCCGALRQAGNATVCCPDCAASSAPALPAPYADLRSATECGADASLACCAQSQALPVPWLLGDHTICCPADGDVGWFTSFTGVPYSSGNWSVTYGQENATDRPRCCPQSNIKQDPNAWQLPYPVCCRSATSVFTSAAYPCCTADQVASGYNGEAYGCCGASRAARGCDGSATQPMRNCSYVEEGDCCPRFAVVPYYDRYNSNKREVCCYTEADPTAHYINALACRACVSGRGLPAVTCCPVANVTQFTGNNSTAMACCPGVAADFRVALSAVGVQDYCCPKELAAEGNFATGTEGAFVCCSSTSPPLPFNEPY